MKRWIVNVVLLLPLLALSLGCQTTTLNIADVGTSANPLDKSGELARDEVWAGKVLVSGNILVPEGVILTIQSGAVVGFEPSDPPYQLIVEGALYAEGEPDNLITFGSLGTADQDPNPGDWAGIFIGTASQNVRLGHCRIRDAVNAVICQSDAAQIEDCLLSNNEVAIICDDASPIASRNQLDTNGTAIRCLGNAAPDITHNEIRANEYGISCDDASRPTIQRNEIVANYRDAILCYATASPEIIANNIVMNGGWAVYNGGRLRDNFLRGNKESGVDVVERSTGRDGLQYYGVEEVFDPRQSPVPDAGIPREGY
ncbi:MAG: right-handed parallel beta-helix repeat-containing protein [Candidatus Poribacteria bacterium]|nr:right-handed parallel beta-helix repeat-containing protein [Candidatus Poribacteria bacterium]MDE0502585.1 right-handed parallel beta-helix repeat-containing protein [Candidatus Poribacteria bacterium]